MTLVLGKCVDSSDCESTSCDEDDHDHGVIFLKQFNPLLIHPVLERVFNFLSIKDVLTVRRVCHEWRAVSNSKLQRLLEEWRIIFVPKMQVKPPPITVHHGHQGSLFDFRKRFTAEDALFFKNFSFRHINLVDNLMTGLFFAEFGQNINQLDIHVSAGQLDSNTFWSIFRLCPNLTSLIVAPHDDEASMALSSNVYWSYNIKTKIKKLGIGSGGIPDTMFVKQLLFACSSLEAFHFIRYLEEDFKVDVLMLSELLSAPCHRTLNELSLRFIDPESESANVIRKLRLKKLTIKWVILSRAESVVELKRLLESQSQSLESLTIDTFEVKSINVETLISLPGMPSLKSLTFMTGMWSGEGWAKHWKLEPIRYPNQFPKLTNLVLSYPSRAVIPELNDEHHSGINSFKVIGYIDWSLLRRISTGFPNISKLSVSFSVKYNGTEMNEMWTFWPNLESLKISVLGSRGYSFDGFISGFNAKDCKRLASSRPKNIPAFEPTTSLPLISITNLKKLKHLELTTEGDIGRKGNNVLIWALSKIHTLEHLKIEKFHKVKMDQVIVLERCLPHLQRASNWAWNLGDYTLHWNSYGADNPFEDDPHSFDRRVLIG